MQLAELQARIHARLPAPFASQPPDIRVYDDEIVIVLHADAAPEPASEQSQRDAELAWIRQQREQTRPLRMQLADELQAMLRRHVAWGMRVGSSEMLFTTRSAPVMTRLGRAEREVLDTLVAAGVAETRSSALAYIVRAFAVEHAEWLDEVREAIAHVQQIRSRLHINSRPGAPEVPPAAPPPEPEQVAPDEEL
jgi:hypothetical protein